MSLQCGLLLPPLYWVYNSPRTAAWFIHTRGCGFVMALVARSGVCLLLHVYNPDGICRASRRLHLRTSVPIIPTSSNDLRQWWSAIISSPGHLCLWPLAHCWPTPLWIQLRCLTQDPVSKRQYLSNSHYAKLFVSLVGWFALYFKWTPPPPVLGLWGN